MKFKPLDWLDWLLLAVILITVFGNASDTIGPQPICAVIVTETGDQTTLSAAQIAAMRSPDIAKYMAERDYPFYTVDKDIKPPANEPLMPAIASSIAAARDQPIPCLVIHNKEGALLYCGSFADETALMAVLHKYGGAP